MWYIIGIRLGGSILNEKKKKWYQCRWNAILLRKIKVIRDLVRGRNVKQAGQKITDQTALTRYLWLWLCNQLEMSTWKDGWLLIIYFLKYSNVTCMPLCNSYHGATFKSSPCSTFQLVALWVLWCHAEEMYAWCLSLLDIKLIVIMPNANGKNMSYSWDLQPSVWMLGCLKYSINWAISVISVCRSQYLLLPTEQGVKNSFAKDKVVF